MSPTLVVNIFVGLGAFIGRAAGGPGGFLIGCCVGLGVGCVITEKMAGRRTITGFWLRNRGAFVGMVCTAVGALLGEYIVGSALGFFGGLFVGIWVGNWMAEQMGWAGQKLAQESNARAAVVALLGSAAQADGPISEKQQQIILRVGREVLAPLGYGDEGDIQRVLSIVQSKPITGAEAGQFVAACPRDVQHAVVYSVLSVLYAHGSLSTARREWFVGFAGSLSDLGLLLYFDRDQVRGMNQQQQWLAELDLKEGATEDEIRQAYRRKAQEYHPDRQKGLPDPIRRLAEAKMGVISEAYRHLRDHVDAGTACLYFRRGEGDGSFQLDSRENAIAACWLCGQKNRVAARTGRDGARCGRCHALLGVPFDPAQCAAAPRGATSK